MKKSNIIIFIIFILLVIAVVATIGILKSGNLKLTEKNEKIEENQKGKKQIEKNPVATMEIENFGIIKIELYPNEAPETVANFVTLANNGFYNRLTFHRIVKDFMIQGGDPNGDGSGGAKLYNLGLTGENSNDNYCIKGEFSLNNVNNTIKHEPYVISMARSEYSAYSSELKEESYNSASSQFFIVTSKNASFLDGRYAAFGKVIEGIDVVDKIESVEVHVSKNRTEKSTPNENIMITTVSVETFGEKYELPKTYEPFNILKWISESK